MPAAYRRECARVDETIEAIEKDSQSTTRFYLGGPMSAGPVFAYTPADEYRSIIVPVLFVRV